MLGRGLHLGGVESEMGESLAEERQREFGEGRLESWGQLGIFFRTYLRDVRRLRELTDPGKCFVASLVQSQCPGNKGG